MVTKTFAVWCMCVCYMTEKRRIIGQSNGQTNEWTKSKKKHKTEEKKNKKIKRTRAIVYSDRIISKIIYVSCERTLCLWCLKIFAQLVPFCFLFINLCLCVLCRNKQTKKREKKNTKIVNFKSLDCINGSWSLCKQFCKQ